MIWISESIKNIFVQMHYFVKIQFCVSKIYFEYY